MLRAAILLIVLTSLGWWLEREQRARRFQRVDELFLDFLVANGRDRLTTPDPAALPQVVFIRFDAAERGEYTAWPPQPLDWQMLIKSLHAHEPSVVVIPEPLNWGNPPPDFIPALAESLIPLPSLIFAVEAQLAEQPATVFLGGLDSSLPRFEKTDGEIALAPAFSALIAAPHELLRRHGELGLIPAGTASSLPYAYREDSTLIPSVIAQVLARHLQTPYSTHRLLLGPGAGAHLKSGLFVPLEKDGLIAVDTKLSVPTINALHLMSGGLADALSAQDKATLSGNKIIVIGTEAARTHAQALASILSLPRLRLLSQTEQWIVWAVLVLVGLWLVLRSPRIKAPTRGFLAIFMTLVVCFLAFQSTLLWFPPTIPVALLSASALVASVIGRRGTR